MKVNNGRLAAILNLIELNFFKMHPLLKPGGHFEFDQVNFFQDAPHLKSHGHFEFYQVEFFQDAYSPEITHFVL